MKKLLVGVAAVALLAPGAALAGDGHDHACIDDVCTVFELFQTPAAEGGASGWQGTEAPKYGTWGFDLNGRDTSVKPGDSFFRYANGAAFDKLTIPSDRTSYGSFPLLRELSDNRMKELIHDLAGRTDLAAGSDEQKIADAYRSYMDEARIEALDAQPLQPFLAAIRAADTHEKIAAYMGQTQGRVGSSFFGTGITIDQKNPNRYVVATGQSGLGMPNRDYYLDARFADKKEKYQAYIERMLTNIGWNDPAGSAAAIIALEDQVAQAHWTPVESRDRDKTYNEYSIQSLAADAPGFDWAGYFNAAGLGSIDRLIVRQNTAMPKIAAV
ncbi:M13 family metallopeptidase, partial [Brevundimonas diminuta]